MNRPDTYTIEDIERYLRGELTGDELSLFEAQMSKDKALADKVENIKNLPTGLYDLEKERLSDQVKDWIKTDGASDEPSKREEGRTWFKKYGKGAIAVVFLIFLATMVYLLDHNSSQNIETRTQQYIAQIHKSPTVLRAASDDQWEMAIQHYRNKDFDQMKSQMKQIIERENATAEQKFYFALAHLYSQPAQFDEALSYFSQVEAQDASIYAEEIAWYRALIHIQLKEDEKARSELVKIESSNQFGSKAKVLLEEMN